MELDVGPDQIDKVTPSDVYDVASLLVSELAYLHAHFSSTPRPHEVNDPGRKFPSHVYQHVRLLEHQLIILDTQISAKPDWLLQETGS